MSSPQLSIKTALIHQRQRCVTPDVDCMTVKVIGSFQFHQRRKKKSRLVTLQDLGGNLRIEAGSRYLTAAADRRVFIDAEGRNGMKSEFLTEWASNHFGMLRAKTSRSHNTSECVCNATSFTEHNSPYTE